MAIGKRIRYFRFKKGTTQKDFGDALGFTSNTSDVRVAQYEAETRVPKDDILAKMAHYFEISPNAQNVPDIDSEIGIMHTLFALEDMYGLKIVKNNYSVSLQLDFNNKSNENLREAFETWQKHAAMLKNGEITQEQYDNWRYNYPNSDSFKQWVNVSAMDLNNFLAGF